MDLNRISAWRKASYSSGNGGNCIEVGTAPGAVAVRDSQDPGGPALGVAPEHWQAFTGAIKTAAGRA